MGWIGGRARKTEAVLEFSAAMLSRLFKSANKCSFDQMQHYAAQGGGANVYGLCLSVLWGAKTC